MTVQTAVVLAAGEGTRLRPLTRNRPKPMLPAANRPILEHVLDALVDAGLDRLVLVVGYRRERVQEYFGPSYRNVPIKYVVQHKQLGSGHALLQAREAVDGPLIVVNGDQIIEASSVRSVRDAFEEETAPAVMAVLERQDASKYGAITLRDRDIEEIVEKPDTDKYRLMNGGIYAFEPSIFAEIDETEREAGELSLTDTIARIVETDRVRGVRIGGLWVDATYPWDLLEVSSEVLARGRTAEPEISEGVWVSDAAGVDEAAVLRPPVVVGSDCEIAPGAVVGPNVALGQNVTVGANATLERTVLDADARVDIGSTLRDAVVGQDVHLGAATTISGGPGDVRVGRQVFEKQRLGAVVADRVRARGDVSFAPGTLVGPNARLHAGTHVSGTISEGVEVMR
ncbi:MULTISPECIES: bifunctional sugar-1-phosphate nucleotidylyltransferase/acetyltransferase [Salinibaculum]|uniref:bifunctional sugar-1-phosphate nucleotidylyltransferase/acetyltransferase n=1 Tax=Salinibaculum TaxID=2732368 RepID=UPI0030CE4630